MNADYSRPFPLPPAYGFRDCRLVCTRFIGPETGVHFISHRGWFMERLSTCVKKKKKEKEKKETLERKRRRRERGTKRRRSSLYTFSTEFDAAIFPSSGKINIVQRNERAEQHSRALSRPLKYRVPNEHLHVCRPKILIFIFNVYPYNTVCWSCNVNWNAMKR